jgi:Rrf2 family nitric oxide-sensitive transcriptional repressor
MQLTRFTDLGLRVLIYLQAGAFDRLTTISEITERFAVSHHHLTKVVQFMGQQGWLVSTPGKGGGVRLARAADAYRLGELIRKLEHSAGMINCAAPPCALLGQCVFKGVLLQAEDAFYSFLNQFTLADMARNPTREAVIRLHLTPSTRRHPKP